MGKVPDIRTGVGMRPQIASVTVTVENRRTGELWTLVGEDPPRKKAVLRWYRSPLGERERHPRTDTVRGTSEEALRRVIERLEEREGPWWVRSISTPATILVDVKEGGRLRYQGNPPAFQATFSEPYLLSRIGRLDLWEPRKHPNAMAKLGSTW